MNAQRLEALMADIRQQLYDIGCYPDEDVDEDNLVGFVTKVLVRKEAEVLKLKTVLYVLNSFESTTRAFYHELQRQHPDDSGKGPDRAG